MKYKELRNQYPVSALLGIHRCAPHILSLIRSYLQTSQIPDFSITILDDVKVSLDDLVKQFKMRPMDAMLFMNELTGAGKSREEVALLWAGLNAAGPRPGIVVTEKMQQAIADDVQKEVAKIVADNQERSKKMEAELAAILEEEI